MCTRFGVHAAAAATSTATTPNNGRRDACIKFGFKSFALVWRGARGAQNDAATAKKKIGRNADEVAKRTPVGINRRNEHSIECKSCDRVGSRRDRFGIDGDAECREILIKFCGLFDKRSTAPTERTARTIHFRVLLCGDSAGARRWIDGRRIFIRFYFNFDSHTILCSPTKTIHVRCVCPMFVHISYVPIVTFHMSARHSHVYVWQFVFFCSVGCRLFRLIGLVSVLLLFSCAVTPYCSARIAFDSYVPSNRIKICECIERNCTRRGVH